MAITEIEDKISEIIDKKNYDTFIYDFLGVYDIPKATITKLKKGINNLSDVAGEVYLKNKLYYKQTDKDLMQSFTDVKAKVDELGTKPRYIFVTNFKEVLSYDTKTDDTLSIPFERLPQKFEFFLAWNGIEKADFDKENPADIRAAERFAKLYDVIVKDNPNATRKGLNLFLIRVLFCLFAEDTDIFEKNLFTTRLKELTKLDGSNLDDFIGQLFSVLDVRKEDRPVDTPSWLADFPYVDGDLFKDQHESLKFTAKSRKLIIDAGEKLEWDQINPDILGSMLQAVASEDSRSHLGMHYTSVPNIMKVIKPLFLDDLRNEFEKSKGNYKKLQHLYDRIGKIKFMDPACGSGNFLIVTYKQLRQLEIDILKEQNRILAEEGSGKAMMYLPSVTLDQFYGIEIDDFACDTTRLSLWIAEHQMNIKLRDEINNAVRPTLPLQHAGAIVCGNALRLDWEKILPHKKDDEVYLFGNPPYLGYSLQSKEQKENIKHIFTGIKSSGYLDYISGWFKKASNYIDENKSMKFAFVSTKSICRGIQVVPLWKNILDHQEIFFAYDSFAWGNNAKNNAQVNVVIIGIASKNSIINKYIYSGLSVKKVGNISPYLAEGPNVFVDKSRAPLFGLPNMLYGSKPSDGGGLLLDESEFLKLKEKGSELVAFLHRFVGSKELIGNIKRYVIWINQEQYETLKNNDYLKSRINVVINSRRKSKKKQTRELANEPWKFAENRFVNSTSGVTLACPTISSGNRIYVPIEIVDNNTVISNTAQAIYNAPLWAMGLLESRMFVTWLKAIGNKFTVNYILSASLVYNTFPVPELSVRRKNEIEQFVLNILDIREEEGGTLAELYGSPLAEKNPKPMNPRLLKAHQELDEVLDRAYKSSGFKDDNDRLALLLDMYSERVKQLNEK
ncbi:DNA methyltransferase [Lactobacillus kefiranofaciens]|uniref:class I SAM-dependent DNA methyltransferase n=1 Tax=Lactobacillus kefiranofaciens TaxID=267818 RepID=UPI000BA64938|nr:DNA methyltransferase [Lactobacillus kefiranofaciens]PAK97795.1 DNA methyltransferase [Lactobacillus kefiranofaciens]